MLGRLDHADDPPAIVAPPAPSRLPAIAIGLAALAVVALPVAVLLRHATHAADPEAGSGSAGSGVDSPPPPPKVATPEAEAAVAAMFGAACRHEVSCGIGDLGRCDYIETTMKQMPSTFAVKPCLDFDPMEARRCLEELAARSCADFAKSLDILDLAAALDRVTSCRRTCK